jgi:disulfide bond formation protein DsbB
MRNSQLLYTVNSLCILGLSLVLAGAFYFQFGLGENPCPLCLLQRMGMFGVILGLGFNTAFGFRKEHAALVIGSALIGASFSIRQILLHISPTPGQPTGYGSAIFGMHLYSWAAVVFATAIAGTAVFLFLVRDETPGTRRMASTFEWGALYLATLLCLMNVVAAFAECRLGACCENGPCPLA